MNIPGRLPTLLVFATALWLGGCGTSQPSVRVNRLVVVGDSNVDDGNLLRITGNQVPAPPNWRGRNSNGPNVADYLSKALGIPMRNVAVAGATSGITNIVALTPAYKRVEMTGLTWQIDQLAEGNGQLRGSDLILLWAGSNDIFGVPRTDRALLDKRIAQSVRNIENAVERLHALGARRLVIANRTPRESLGTENDQNGVELNTAIGNAIPVLRQRLDIEIRIFDAYASISHMMRNPSQYGFTETGALCIQVAVCAGEKFEDGQPLASKYVNWDAAHKTTRVHKLMAEQLQLMLQQ